MSSGIFGTIIDGLKYVTNPYALIGFLCLLCVYVITHYHIVPPPDWIKKQAKRWRITSRGKQVIVAILNLVVIIMSGLLLRGAYEDARYEKEIYIVKGGLRVKLCRQIEVKLIDITTLAGIKIPSRPGLEYNLDLSMDRSNVEYIHKRVFEKAGVANPDKAAQKIWDMNQKQWEDFLNDQDEIVRRKILDIPFAKFRVYINSKEDSSFENRYYFNGEDVEVGTERTSPNVKFRVKHVYDTFGRYPDEPEAVFVQMIR